MTGTHCLLKPFGKIVTGFGNQSEQKGKFVIGSVDDSVHRPKPVLDMNPACAVVDKVHECEGKALGSLFT